MAQNARGTARYKGYPKYKESGTDWMGEIPAHWSIERFRNIFRESPEKIDREVVGEMLSVSGYRGIEIKEYDDDGRRRRDEDLVGYRIVRPGQLVVNTMWLNYAGLGISDFEGHVSPAYRSYWVPEALDKRFVHHLMRSEAYVKGYTKYLKGIRPNSLQMGREDLMSFPILIPSIDEQRAIAAFLDRETARIDALVAKKEQLIERLRERRSALITRAVTKGLDASAPMKDSGVEGYAEIPKHWMFRRLKEVAVVEVSNVDKKSAEGEDPVLLCNYVDVYYNDKITSDLEFMPATASKGQKKRFTLRVGDVLITKDSESWKDIAVPAYVSEVVPNLVCGYHLAMIRPNPEIVNGRFLSRVFSAVGPRDQFQNAANGITRYGLSNDAIRNALFAIPPLAEQEAIAAFLDAVTIKIDGLIGRIREGIVNIKEYRSSLISSAVTGKIDVRGPV